MEGAARALQHTYQQTRLLKQLLMAEQQQRMQERFTQQQTYANVVTTLQGASHPQSIFTAAGILIRQLCAAHALSLSLVAACSSAERTRHFHCSQPFA